MTWDGFKLTHRTPLHRIQGNLTGIRYRDEILGACLKYLLCKL